MPTLPEHFLRIYATATMRIQWQLLEFLKKEQRLAPMSERAFKAMMVKFEKEGQPLDVLPERERKRVNTVVVEDIATSSCRSKQ
ncbi:hypothetical protein TNCV_2690531 [Trichonephila clavipes]|uniref:Uncharacterized protein n=1 Tax=Trichonephila clavipes TaxID=2585209 RepID=A0A8X6VYE1_TRICX|nr:hypothetical protein TNCV_2690531 [Trichonephila clavipes]